MGSCFFIGNHDAPAEVERELREAVEQHITVHGVTHFIAGHYGAFDAMQHGLWRRRKRVIRIFH